ncbi:hypothetical protein JTE90_000584 [Oedothorax gibbosus]|uniref:Elongation of very long chain fatty acids protein n=1 Tax=Oedothorax gibbosus TaxID=931172 RepID=A0AAV6VXF8_9ARAC|nr:hypothetical protein JTE90_000584 [Oedothorax gibbosus]
MTAKERFEDYWSWGGHPVVKNRFLLSSVYPMVTLITSYVLFVKVVGPYIMRNRKPVQMRPLIVVYNFSLVIFYVWYLLRGALFIPQMGISLFCGSLLRYDKDIVEVVFFHAYILYVARFVELLDTVFLVLTKKFNMVTSLHVFHHAIVPVFGWFGFRSETSAYLSLFIGVNSFVHVIMYSYYAIAALGPKYQKYIWWKKYLTSLQILQFFVMTIYMNFMYIFGCVESISIFIFSNFLSILFFFLFINYYRGTYNKADKKEDSGNNEPKKTNGVLNENGIHRGSITHRGSISGSLPAAYKNAVKKKE